MPMDYKATLQRAAEKFRASATLAAAEGLIPYKSENGRWIPSPYDGNSWWTGGFWPGLMWQFYAATGDEAFLREARRTEELLTAEFRRFGGRVLSRPMDVVEHVDLPELVVS